MLDGRDFSESLVAILKDGKWEYMNKKGEIAVPFNYESARDFTNGMLPIWND